VPVCVSPSCIVARLTRTQVFPSLLLTSINLNEAVPVALNISLDLLLVGLLSWCLALFPRARYECEDLMILPWVCAGLAGAIA